VIGLSAWRPTARSSPTCKSGCRPPTDLLPRVRAEG
jgi:hypothetical protein